MQCLDKKHVCRYGHSLHHPGAGLLGHLLTPVSSDMKNQASHMHDISLGSLTVTFCKQQRRLVIVRSHIQFLEAGQRKFAGI